MANDPNREAPPAHDHAQRPFFVMEWSNPARTAELDHALSQLRAAAREHPDKTWIVCQILATAEPTVSATIIHHRL